MLAFPRFPGRFAAVLVLAVGSCSLAQSQQLGNVADLEKPYLDKKAAIAALITGKEPVTAESKELIDLLARYYLHRLTWPVVNSDPKKIHEIQRELDYEIIRAALLKPNKPFLDAFGPALVRAYKELLALDFLQNRAVLVNAGTMMTSYSKLRSDEFGEYLTEVADNPKMHETVRLMAIKAMRDYMPARVYVEENDGGLKQYERQRERDTKRINALVHFIEREWPSHISEDAVRYLRREAIETLSLAQVAAVAVHKKAKQVEGAVAPTLLKTFSATALTPPTGLDERLEAAIGLGMMKTAGLDHWDPSMSAYAIGKAMEEFALEYNKNWATLAQPGTKVTVPPAMAWKADSKRLEYAVSSFLKNNPTLPGPAKELESYSAKLLKPMPTYGQVEPAQVIQARRYLDTIKPKTQQAFKDPPISNPIILLD